MEKSEKKNIYIQTGDFFPTWVFVFFFVLIVAATIAVFQFELYAFLIVTILLSVIIWFSKKIFEFDPNTKCYRKGVDLWGIRLGKWHPLEIEQGYIAFQRYDENSHYTYGGLLNRSVTDTIYELRLVYPNSTFKTLVSGNDFQAVAMMLQLGKLLALIYHVDFKDYVKNTIHKKNL